MYNNKTQVEIENSIKREKRELDDGHSRFIIYNPIDIFPLYIACGIKLILARLDLNDPFPTVIIH